MQKIFTTWIFEENFNIVYGGDKNADVAGKEMHALSSAAKPLCSWMTRDAIQDCRESCAGHGYLKGILFAFRC